MTQEKITRENLRELLKSFVNSNNLEVKKLAAAIGCSAVTLERIISNQTYPSEEMIKQCGIMFTVGFLKYKKLTKAEREKISETIGSVGGGILGFGVITSVISASGVAGLSAAGISSGLAATGAIVGGGMVAGILSVAAIPILAAGAGCGLIKVVKYGFSQKTLNDNKIDIYWEVSK